MKKTLSLMLVLGLALGLAACSKNQKADAAADLQAAADSNYDAIVAEEEEVVEAVEEAEAVFVESAAVEGKKAIKEIRDEYTSEYVEMLHSKSMGSILPESVNLTFQ